MISLVGCQQNNTIIKPYVETKMVTENSQLDLVTFTFESPDSWTTVAADKDSLICRSPSSNESEEYKNYISQDYLVISNYTTNDILPVSDEYKQGYEDLFKGTYDGIEKIISDSIEYINISKYLDSLPDGETGSKYSFLDLLNILSDPDSFPDYEIPDSLRNKTWASDFKYTEYQGKDGKIITVEYSYLLMILRIKLLIVIEMIITQYAVLLMIATRFLQEMLLYGLQIPLRFPNITKLMTERY